MKHPLRRCLALILATSFLECAAADANAWVAFDVPLSQETKVVSSLESRSVPTISWSNAVVEVSAFREVEMTPLSELSHRLTEGDPRWDPWLRSLKSQFRPRDGVVRIWVPQASQGLAAEIAGSLGTSTSAVSKEGRKTPRQITGWLLLIAGGLWLTLRLIAGWKSGFPAWTNWRLWLWLPGLLGILVLGMGLIGGIPTGTHLETAPRATASWSQHLWYQQSWPYGAAWSDWKPGKAWQYPSAERRDGRVVSTVVSLPAPDEAWLKAALAARDGHHAGLIFASENP